MDNCVNLVALVGLSQLGRLECCTKLSGSVALRPWSQIATHSAREISHVRGQDSSARVIQGSNLAWSRNGSAGMREIAHRLDCATRLFSCAAGPSRASSSCDAPTVSSFHLALSGSLRANGLGSIRFKPSESCCLSHNCSNSVYCQEPVLHDWVRSRSADRRDYAGHS